MGYKKDAIKGISWLGAFRILNRAISFGKIAIIARILAPAQYGVYGVASLVLSLLEVFTETGINIVLIQEKDAIDKFINTAWIISILRGSIIALVLIICAGPISSFFHSPQSYTLLLLISLVPFLRGFINPSVAKFIKDLKYNKEFYYRTLIFFVETVVSIASVVLLKNPIGIVYGLIAGALFEVIISFILARPIPGFSYNRELFHTIFHRGKWITFSGILNFLYQNFDNIVVGRVLGTYYLGIYDRAYNISMLPISEVSDVITRATFPVYVRIAHDRKRLLAAFYKTTGLVAAITIPVCIIFFLFPQFIISVLLGPKWLATVPVLQVLAFFGIVRAFTYSVTSLMLALKKQNIVTIIMFISLTGMALTILPFISLWHVIGAGIAAIFGALIALPFSIYYMIKVLREIE